MMAGDQLSADPGVAVNANAENATADAAAILPIVFMIFSCVASSRARHTTVLRAVLVNALATSSLTELRLRETGRELKM
jgi:hypothetical protein